LKCVRSRRCRASSGDGCAEDGGNRSSNSILKVLMLKACANEIGEFDNTSSKKLERSGESTILSCILI